MGIHNYAYMNILMNKPFQKQNNLTSLKGPLSSCTGVIFSLISVLENTLFRILYYFLCKNTVRRHSFLFYLTIHIIYLVSLTMAVSLCSGRPYSQPSTPSEQEKASKGSESDGRKDKLSSTEKSFKQPDFHPNMEFSSGKL